MLQWMRLYTLGSRGSRELKTFLEICLISSRIDQNFSLQRERTSIYREVCAKLVDRGPRCGFHSVWFQPSDRAKLVTRDVDFTPCNFSHQIALNQWDRGPWRGFHSVWFQLSNCVINPDRPISLFTARRHHVGMHVGLRGPTTCPHRATSPPWVPHD